MDERPDLVADAAIRVHGVARVARFYGFLYKAWRIVERSMDDAARIRDERTCFVRVSTDGDEKIAFLERPPIELGRYLVRDVDVDLRHRSDCSGIEAVRFHACAAGVDPITVHVVRESFSHLASAGVPCAKEEDDRSRVH